MRRGRSVAARFTLLAALQKINVAFTGFLSLARDTEKPRIIK